MDEHWRHLLPSEAAPATMASGMIRALLGGGAAPYTSAEAFRTLYERTHMSVYRFVYTLHGGPAADVEDIAAETFERAWNGRARFRGDEHDAMGWLLTIARNLVIDKQRAEHRRPLPMALDDLDRELLADAVVEHAVLQDEQQCVLVAALQTLPIEEREMIVLQYVLGWQVKRIAARYRMRPNTATVKLRRALERLRHQQRDEMEMER